MPIEPDQFTFRVSERIRDERSDGRVPFEIEGTRWIVRPELPDERPNGAHHHGTVNGPEG